MKDDLTQYNQKDWEKKTLKARYNSLSEDCAFDNKNFIHYFAWILLQSKVNVDFKTTEKI